MIFLLHAYDDVAVCCGARRVCWRDQDCGNLEATGVENAGTWLWLPAYKLPFYKSRHANRLDPSYPSADESLYGGGNVVAAAAPFRSSRNFTKPVPEGGARFIVFQLTSTPSSVVEAATRRTNESIVMGYPSIQAERCVRGAVIRAF